MDHDKVAIIGSGNWGSAISIIIGKNCQEHDCFDTTVMMYVHNEPVTVTSTVNTATTSNTVTKPLADVINERHENVKYLPGIKLPLNIKATSDIQEACQDATLLVFVTPHQFLMPLMPKIREALTSNSSSSPYSYYYSCRGVNLSKGLDFDEKLKQPVLISTAIEAAMVGSDVGGLQHQQQQQQQRHGFSCGALMGAIVANEVAAGELCEATLACDFGQLTNERTRKLFNAPMFRVQHIYDTSGAQIGGALKNVIALGAGFVDALGLGENTKSALLRIGLLEMARFGQFFFSGVRNRTWVESCGIADLVTTCYGGRNRKCAEAFALEILNQDKNKDNEDPNSLKEECEKRWKRIETDLLDGQKLQGTWAVQKVYVSLEARQCAEKFPLMSKIYHISYEGRPVQEILDGIRVIEEGRSYY